MLTNVQLPELLQEVQVPGALFTGVSQKKQNPFCWMMSQEAKELLLDDFKRKPIGNQSRGPLLENALIWACAHAGARNLQAFADLFGLDL